MSKKKTFKCLSALLSYPSDELKLHLDDIRLLLIDDGLLDDDCLKKINLLITYLNDTPLLALQEQYVELFDRIPTCSLHLFEHVHGDSRNRGQAMVDLLDLYKEAGLEINTKELPDFTPLFLEFLSTINYKEAIELLGDTITIVAIIGERVKINGSLYHTVFDVLQKLSAKKIDADKIAGVLAKDDKHKKTFDDLDEDWEEKAAFSGCDPLTRSTCEFLNKE